MTKKESRKKRKIYSKGEVTKTENTSISKEQEAKTNKKKSYSYVGGRGKTALSIFRKYQAELREKGIVLSYNGKLFERIAEKSLALDTGARELSNTVNHMFENIMYDIFANPYKYQKCILELEIVEDNTRYKLI